MVAITGSAYCGATNNATIRLFAYYGPAQDFSPGKEMNIVAEAKFFPDDLGFPAPTPTPLDSYNYLKLAPVPGLNTQAKLTASAAAKTT